MARESGDTFLSWACKALLIWLLFIRQTSFADPVPISPIPHPRKWSSLQTCPAVWSSRVCSCTYLKWPAWAPPFLLLELVNSYLLLETASVSPCLWSSLTTLLPWAGRIFSSVTLEHLDVSLLQQHSGQRGKHVGNSGAVETGGHGICLDVRAGEGETLKTSGVHG